VEESDETPIGIVPEFMERPTKDLAYMRLGHD